MGIIKSFIKKIFSRDTKINLVFDPESGNLYLNKTKVDEPESKNLTEESNIKEDSVD